MDNTSDSASDQVMEQVSAPSSPQQNFTQQQTATDVLLRPFPAHAADSSDMQLNTLQNGARTVQRRGYAGIYQGGEDRLIYDGQFVQQSVESQLVPRQSSEFPACFRFQKIVLLSGDREPMN